jgi:hypothetical protein
VLEETVELKDEPDTPSQALQCVAIGGPPSFQPRIPDLDDAAVKRIEARDG